MVGRSALTTLVAAQAGRVIYDDMQVRGPCTGTRRLRYMIGGHKNLKAVMPLAEDLRGAAQQPSLQGVPGVLGQLLSPITRRFRHVRRAVWWRYSTVSPNDGRGRRQWRASLTGCVAPCGSRSATASEPRLPS